MRAPTISGTETLVEITKSVAYSCQHYITDGEGNMRIKKVEHLTALFHWIGISRILTSFEQIYAVRHLLYSTIFFWC